MILDCPWCEANVSATPVGAVTYFDIDAIEKYRYTLTKCDKCEFPLLAVQDLDEDHDGQESASEPLRVFPPRNEELSLEVPHGIRQTYNEAWACFRARAYTAAAIMCRKALEIMSVELGAPTGRNVSLAKQLEHLLKSESIDKTLYDWAHEFKEFGNEAAHDHEVIVNKQDVEELLKLTQALLENAFTYRMRFKEFKERRVRRQV